MPGAGDIRRHPTAQAADLRETDGCLVCSSAAISGTCPLLSVVATLQCELFDQQPGGRPATRREAKLAVFDYLKTFYNPRRRHSALGNIAPATFEARHTLTTAA